jgi:AcrR family transcriptional regulator
VDAALNLADRRDWESVRLHDIAAEEKISLDDIRHHYREKEDLVDAWFDRADQAMLKVSEDMSWLDTLAAHRRVTRQMIFGKLEIGHLHYQINGLLRVSRTVQWLREAAGRDTRLPLRAIEETGLTALYLATFLHWMFDDSHGSKSTSQFLHRRLGLSETSRMPD